MSQHLKNSGSQILMPSSPSQFIQEVSQEELIRKVFEKRILELELKLRQQENLIQRQQSQLFEASQEAQQIGNQFEDALNDVRQMRLIGEKKDQKIEILIQENEKLVLNNLVQYLAFNDSKLEIKW